jgi:ABC-2 type transport system permease protein
MTSALVSKAIRDARLLFGGLLLLAFFFPWIHIWFSGKLRLSAFSEFLSNAVPRDWERFSAVPFSEVATPAGRIALAYGHPMILLATAAWAIARGSDCVSGEIGRGTMEMLLAQPVRRSMIYTTQAIVTVLGGAMLALAVWCGTAVGLSTVELPASISPRLYIPAAVNLFGLVVCLGGMSALASSCDSYRWRTIGLMIAVYVITTVLQVVGRISDDWQWASYLSLLNAYEPQAMVARPEEAWSLLAYENGAVAGLGLGGLQLVLFGLGLVCYAMGAVIFNRREIPAPL